jgi:hypothetical protein
MTTEENNVSPEVINTDDLPLPGESTETQVDDRPTESSDDDHTEASDAGYENNSSNDELPLPDPDEEEVGNKKSLPKWAEKRLSKKDREIALRAQEIENLRLENERLKSNTDRGYQREEYGSLDDQFTASIQPPRREDFDDEDDYDDARADYRDRKKQIIAEREYHNNQMREAETRFRNNMTEAIDKGAEKYNDFEEKVAVLFSKEFPANRGMGEAIVLSPHKEDLLYFLGTYKDVAFKIANSNPVQAAKEIAKLEMRFEAKKKANISKAPSPVNPLKGGNSSGVVEKNPEKMGQEEFESWYRSKIKKK